MKHTLGPWFITRSGRYIRHLHGHGPNICDLDVFGGPREECEANALLIAAAPEMLALLNKFVELDIPCPFRGNDGRLKDFCEWYKNVQAVITKVEGVPVSAPRG